MSTTKHSTFSVRLKGSDENLRTYQSLGAARSGIKHFVGRYRHYTMPAGTDIEDYEIVEHLFETRSLGSVHHPPVRPVKTKDPLRGVKPEIPVMETA